MKHTILLISLSLIFFAASPWAQDKDKAPAAEEPKENTTEDAKEEDQEIVNIPKKPKRLPSNTARERIPDSEDSSMKLLSDSLPKDALLWLDTEYGRFLSLWQKDRSGDAKGALLIIHAEGEHPAWPNTTKPLHDTLPDNGWATLAISLPSPDERAIPKRTLPTKVKRFIKTESDDEDNVESIEDEKSSEQAKTEAIANDDIAERKTESVNNVVKEKIELPKEKENSAEIITEKRLEAALQFLHDQGQFNLIVLGNGSGAIRAHDFIEKITPKIDNPRLKEKLERPIRAMILVNGRNQLPTMKETYQNWFSDPEIPVLDIFFKGDYRNAADAKYRKTLARQKKALNYKQVRLSLLNSEKSWGENTLSRRVRSFLDTNAVGVEVKNAKLRRYK